MKVMVTGASGFIGMPTARLLARRGHDVCAVCTRPEFALEGVRVCRADLMNREQTDALVARERPDALVHLAWIATPGIYRQSPDNLAWVSESLRLLEAFVKVGGRRAVVAGTCFEYDLSCGFLREDVTPEVPDTLYGSAKLSLSLLARAYAREVGLSLAWARLFFLYGEREASGRAIPDAILSALRGQPVRCNQPEALRDYMSENEAARALCHILESDVDGVVNVASGTGPSMRDIFSYIAGQLGASDRLAFGNAPARPAVVIGDAAKLRREAGFVPGEEWREGIMRCMEWWKRRERQS